MTRNRAVAVLALLVLVLAARPAQAEPRAPMANASRVDDALESVNVGGCAEQLRRELVAGRRFDQECERARVAAAKALVRGLASRVEFGVVEHRRVSLSGVRLVLSSARRCRTWVLRAPNRDVVVPTDATWAGCRLRRYVGNVGVSVVAANGDRHANVLELQTDKDGGVDVRFTDVDGALRAQGLHGLDGFARLEIGEQSWGGAVDLRRLRGFLATWHFEWVRKGWGVPGLFAHRHPEHGAAGAARAMAVEATLARQERDYLSVARGEIEPRAFLDRYSWSPYRVSVASMATTAPAGAEETDLAEIEP